MTWDQDTREPELVTRRPGRYWTVELGAFESYRDALAVANVIHAEHEALTVSVVEFDQDGKVVKVTR